MWLRPSVVIILALISLSCGGGGTIDSSDAQKDWRHVLSRKRAALAAAASAREKQTYADTLGAFVQKHPTHSRARAVYERIELDFASELATLGRHQDAIRFYRAVLAHDPANEEALRGVSTAFDRLAISRSKLQALEKGMSRRRVADLLGRPVPGWTVRNDRRDATIESWYYRTIDGGVAGIYFRDGVLFAAEASSNARLAALSR